MDAAAVEGVHAGKPAQLLADLHLFEANRAQHGGLFQVLVQLQTRHEADGELLKGVQAEPSAVARLIALLHLAMVRAAGGAGGSMGRRRRALAGAAAGAGARRPAAGVQELHLERQHLHLRHAGRRAVPPVTRGGATAGAARGRGAGAGTRPRVDCDVVDVLVATLTVAAAERLLLHRGLLLPAGGRVAPGRAAGADRRARAGAARAAAAAAGGRRAEGTGAAGQHRPGRRLLGRAALLVRLLPRLVPLVMGLLLVLLVLLRLLLLVPVLPACVGRARRAAHGPAMHRTRRIIAELLRNISIGIQVFAERNKA
mmetsp:Transcript_107662/g.309911  ORF Transcript_107662/g.309911 Transcript_107662/m.309911 type:complete len:313 (-) Transcript_107662:536-1474(-)